MLFLKFAAFISAIFGLMFLFAPKMLADINNAVNKVLLNLDAAFYKMRIGIGILLCALSCLMFFVIYYMAHKIGIR